jgi:hypothetical protein
MQGRGSRRCPIGALPHGRSCEARSALRRSLLAVTLALGCAFPVHSIPAEAATVPLLPEADTWVSSDAPSTNHGSDTTLQIGGHLTAVDRRSYLRFNGTVPPGAVVTRTTLRIYFDSAPSGGYQLRITNPPNSTWGEGTATWNTPPSPSFTGPVSGETGVIRPG